MKNIYKKFLMILFAALIVAGLSGCGASSSDDGRTNTGVTEKKAPDFTARTLTGSEVNYNSDLKGKPLVLNFAASWCGPCELEAPVLVSAYEKYGDKVQFFGLAVRDKLEDQLAFSQKHGLQFAIGLDPDSKIVFQYQRAARVSMSGIPTTFFIDAEGNIVDFYIGPVTERIFDQKVQSILPTGASTVTAP